MMNAGEKTRRQAQRGAALVIAIFTLMLISVVATAMILMSDSETAMKGNYKSAMQAFYDARAGLEEARGRLWLNSSDSNVRNCVFPGGGNMPVGQVCYIVNPASGETVDPANLDPANPYADFEYNQEWNMPVTAAPGLQAPILSNSPVASVNIAGPLYKWVRITPRTEVSANFDSDADGIIDNTSLFFTGTNAADSKNGFPPGAAQILEITALAVTPYGSRRMVQYTVAGPTLTGALANFPSALTLAGNGVTFTGPGGGNGNGNGGGSNSFQINGNDSSAPAGTQSGVPAIGYTNSDDASNLSAAAVPSSNYLSPAGIPSIGLASMPLPLQTPSGLDSLVQSITQNADLVINPPEGTVADQSSLTSMSPTNPMVVVVNGDFHLTHIGGSTPFTGYGLLLVTGTLHYDPDDSWNGIILVIGKGIFDGSQRGNGGQINGVVFVANTRDNSGNLLMNLGPASFNQTGGGKGIRYNSNSVSTTQGLPTYQILSFREIAQTTP